VGVNQIGDRVAQTEGEARERLAAIVEQMGKAAGRFGVLSLPPRLVAVSKTFEADAIRPFLRAGQRVFGENRVGESKEKWPGLRGEFPEVELHLIGPLQTNKVRDAVATFDVIQTVDRDRLAEALRAEMDRTGRELPVFVQVNIGAEEQKSGIAPSEAVKFVERCRVQHGLQVQGLMCIPPDGAPPGPYFAQMVDLGRRAEVPELSMGMSGDFPTAIELGATLVRVGSALFGQRA